MTLHHLLIDLTAKTRNLTVPADLEAWLLDEYGWEAIDDLMEPSDSHGCHRDALQAVP